MATHIRQATACDLDRAADIIESARQTLAKRGIPQWQTGYPNKDSLVKDIENSELLLLEKDGEIVSLCALIFSGEPDYDTIDGAWLTTSSSNDPSYAVIHRAATDERHIGHSYMKALFREAATIAQDKGCKSMRVDTHLTNSAMRNMLESLGYIHCGTITLSDRLGEVDPKRVAYELII